MPPVRPAGGTAGRTARWAAAVLTTALALVPAVSGIPAGALPTPPRPSAEASRAWLWPAVGQRTVVVPYAEPAHRYGPGHRGVDVAADGSLVSPAAGTVAFVGTVAGRPLITIAHAAGLVTTLEPVASTLVAGAQVAAGDVVGVPASGGHAPPGTVHFGVRRDGEYVNPMQFFGNGRRAVLLPCC